MKAKRTKKYRSGAILPLAVILVIVLALIGIGLLRLGLNARLQVVRNVKVLSARQAADAGMQHAVRYMIDSWNGALTPDTWLANWEDLTPWTDPAIPATALAHSFGPVNLGDTYGNASFTYEIYKGTKANGYQIVSTGTAAGTTRTVRAAAVLRSVFFGIGAKEDIYISPNMELGTVPDNGAFIVQTNSTEDNAITLKPNIVIPGDVVVGPGGDTDTAVDLAKSVNVEGDTRAAEDYIDFPPVYVPKHLSDLLPTDPVIDTNDNSIAHIYGNIKLDNLEYGSGVLKDVETIFIHGEVDIFVDGLTRLNSNSKIIVADGSSLTLYLGGDMQAMPGSNITYGDTTPVTDNEIIEAASSISIQGTVALDGTPNCTNIEFKPNDNYYGTIYAPDASLQLEPGGDFYGAIVGGNDIELKPGGTFMFIPSLVNIMEEEVLYMGIKHGSWWEN